MRSSGGALLRLSFSFFPLSSPFCAPLLGDAEYLNRLPHALVGGVSFDAGDFLMGFSAWGVCRMPLSPFLLSPGCGPIAVVVFLKGIGLVGVVSCCVCRPCLPFLAAPTFIFPPFPPLFLLLFLLLPFSSPLHRFVLLRPRIGEWCAPVLV